MPGIKSKRISEFYQKSWNDLICDLYLSQELSPKEIARRIVRETNITINDRWIYYTVRKLGISRSKSEARYLGIKTGRVDYTPLKNPIKSADMRRGISLKVRYAVLKRDGFKCVLCGSGADKTQLRVDHKIPIVRGGTNNIENLQTLCSPCNHGKMIYEREK